MKNPEELINWRIWLNHVIQNKQCKSPESHFDMVQMLLGGKEFLMRMTKRVVGRTEMTKKKRQR
eukprot:3258041-Ditylum_brightwellii.AAC.1